MRSLSSSMTCLRSAMGLHVSEPRGASAEGQRPEQAGIERCAQKVALQHENERGGRHRMQSNIAPVLHRTDTPLPSRLRCAVALHVVSLSVVNPPAGAEN